MLHFDIIVTMATKRKEKTVDKTSQKEKSYNVVLKDGRPGRPSWKKTDDDLDEKIKEIESYLRSKRDELIWALSLQDFNDAQIGRIFNLNRSTIKRIIENKPLGWKPKWQKVHDN